MELYAYIANRNSGTVSILDLENLTKEDLAVGGSPFEVIKSSANNDLWIRDIYNSTAKVFDIVSREMKYQNYFQYINKILLSPDGSKAFILYQDYPIELEVLDAQTYSSLNHFQLSNFSWFSDAVLSPDGQKLHVVRDYKFSTIDLQTGATLNTLDLSYGAERITLSPDGQHAFLYGYDFYIQKIDLVNFSQTSNYVGDELYSIAVSRDGERLFAGYYYESSVDIINSQTLQVMSSLSVNTSRVMDLKVSANGKLLYVLHRDSPNFEIYDIDSGARQAYFNTGATTYRFDLSGSSYPFIELNPPAGSVASGQTESVTLLINSAGLSHKTYRASLKFESNDPATPTLSLPLTIIARDTRGPDFNLVFFQNPYLSKYLRIMVFAREKLTEMPALSVDEDSSVSLMMQDSLHNIYMAKHLLTGSSELTVSVSGSDSLGNEASFERTLGVTNIIPGKPVSTTYSPGNVTIDFPANCFNNELFVIVWAEKSEKADEAVAEKIYHIGPEEMVLKSEATVTIAYEEGNQTNFDPLHLSIYQQEEENKWRRLDSRIDKENQLVAAKIKRLGVFKLGYDPAFVSGEIENIPTHYSLEQNYPNPFNPTTTIVYSLPTDSRVTLKIFDVLGREVKTLIKEWQEAGKYRYRLNSSDLPSGVYFYQLSAGSFSKTRKMIVLR